MRFTLLLAVFLPSLSYQISLHLGPHLALIFIPILPWPTEGTQLIFDGTYVFFFFLQIGSGLAELVKINCIS